MRRAARAGIRPPAVSLRAWAEHLHRDRRPADVMGASEGDDVSDPLGKGPQAFEDAAREIAALIETLVPLLWPPRSG